MVLLHGFPENGTLWRFVWDKLASTHMLIIPDFPGGGQSILEDEAGIDDMARCVKSILDAEGIEKAVIAGHSMGGYVTFSFADQFPEYVAGISLVHSTPDEDDEEKKKMRKKVIELVRRGAKDAFLRLMVSGLFAEEFKQNKRSAVEEQIRCAMEMSNDGIINFYTAMMNRQDRSNIIENSSFPIQWIIGAHDSVIDPKKLLQFCYKSYINFVSVYEDCGHMSMIEDPDRLGGDMMEFANYCYERK